MSETDRLRESVAAILSNAKDPASLQAAVQLMKDLSDIDRQAAESKKLVAEERKLDLDREMAKSRVKSDSRQAYVVILAPILTNIILAGTLILQSYQFVRSESDKRAEAEDARWADTIKLLSQSNKLSPAGVLLKSFIRSDRYRAEAYQTVSQVLIKTDDPLLFTNLFDTVFDKPTWANLPQIMDVDRALYASIDPILTKSYDPSIMSNDPKKLSLEEEQKLAAVIREIDIISATVERILKSPRPAEADLDLSNAAIWDCDLAKVDFTGANLDSVNLSTVNLRGASFKNVAGAETAYTFGTAWWLASSMDPALLKRLESQSPYSSKVAYNREADISQSQYDTEIKRLSQK